MSYQQVIIQGNLTRDLETRKVGENMVAQTGVAVSEKYRKQDGTVVENTEFFDLEIWGKEAVYPYLTKGQSVLVVGKQRTDKWQDQNGQQRERKKIRVDVVQLCGARPQNQQGQQAPAQQPQYQHPAPAPAQPRYPAPPAQAPAPQPTYQQSATQPHGFQGGYNPQGFNPDDQDIPF